MTEKAFWEIIERARTSVAATKEIPDWIENHLAAMPLNDMLDFSAWIAAGLNRSNDAPVALVCGIICRVADYVSDDSFLYFRCWLIAQGKDVFETALADSDSLATKLPPLEYEYDQFGPSPFLESLMYVTLKPFALKSGGRVPREYREVLPLWKPPRGSKTKPTEMARESFWDGDKRKLRNLFPKLTARFLSLVFVVLTLSATLASSPSSS